MPRKSRIRLVGKLAARQADALARETEELAYQLHAQWQRRGDKTAETGRWPGDITEESS